MGICLADIFNPHSCTQVIKCRSTVITTCVCSLFSPKAQPDRHEPGVPAEQPGEPGAGLQPGRPRAGRHPPAGPRGWEDPRALELVCLSCSSAPHLHNTIYCSLLPPDVDVPHPDEKSLITYVSSLYDAMPRVPDVQSGVRANVSLLFLLIRSSSDDFEDRD